MKLDVELIDVAGDFCALRFVFFQAALQLARVADGNAGRFATVLTGKGHPRGCAFDHEGNAALLASKKQVALFARRGRSWERGHVPS
jgi:hypothetical protein